MGYETKRRIATVMAARIRIVIPLTVVNPAKAKHW